jgi:phage terminase small subunit
MPAKKLPTALLNARGSFKHRPSRKRDNEPQVSEPLGAPPGHLTASQVKCWQEVAEQAPLGVLSQADRHAVEMTACLLDEFRTTGTDMIAAKLARLQSLLGSFGCTPSDRASLSLPQAKPVNPFEALG